MKIAHWTGYSQYTVCGRNLKGKAQNKSDEQMVFEYIHIFFTISIRSIKDEPLDDTLIYFQRHFQIVVSGFKIDFIKYDY